MHPTTRSGMHLMQSMNITKIIVPAAGLGTRLLPLTKALPKEMMPLLDKPALQYILQEGFDSGISSFCIVMNDDKKHIVERYFSKNAQLDALLAQKGQQQLTHDLYALFDSVALSFVPQPKPLGLGHAVLMGSHCINPDEYFGVMLPDDIIDSAIPGMQQLITLAQRYNASVVAVETVSPQAVSSYGIITPKHQLADGVIEIANLVEKPKPENAPSHLGIIGRYILPYRIFDAIEQITPYAQGEIQLTDAISYLLQRGERVIACIMQGTRYDIGSIPGLLHATLSLGLKKEPYHSLIKSSCTQNIIAK